MISKRESGLWGVVGLLSVALFWATMDPVPYRDVEILRAEARFHRLEVVANFEKTNCEFQRLVAVGGLAGQTSFLRWTDMDGIEPNHDRDNGAQTLRIAIDPQGVSYDWIEIRTRHDCDGEKVDKVFARFEPVPKEVTE